MNDVLPLQADICICTFRREHIVMTLESLKQLQVPSESKITIIVADNDETPSARQRVEAVAARLPFPVNYIHAPARNISVARNACLDAATAPLVAFIDDDELVTPYWLVALVSRQRQSGADIVLGPVTSHYPNMCAAWLKREDFHSIKPVRIKGAIMTGYTSNVLFLREAAVLKNQRFSLAYGRSGGEDTAFFTSAHAAGARIDFAPDAIVTETVAPERLAFGWLLRRSFRSGQTHGALLLTDNKSLFINILRAGAKATFCGVVALGCLVIGRRWRYWLWRGALHAGVVARLSGVAEIKLYG